MILGKVPPLTVLELTASTMYNFYTPTHRVGAILQSPCPSVRSHFCNRYLDAHSSISIKNKKKSIRMMLTNVKTEENKLIGAITKYSGIDKKI
jgi:hypothetical protein